MKRSLLIFSGWISLFLLAGYPCSAQDKLSCKATLLYHGHEFSGRMMFKQVSPDTIRFAFFNEPGMSFVQGRVFTCPQRSEAGIQMEIHQVAPFLDHRSFRKNLERGLILLLKDQHGGGLKLPVREGKTTEPERIYRKSNNFMLELQL